VQHQDYYWIGERAACLLLLFQHAAAASTTRGRAPACLLLLAQSSPVSLLLCYNTHSRPQRQLALLDRRSQDRMYKLS